jgi:ABC-type Fe3+-hydroxamate transport system substrate-binding protein
MNNRVIAIVAVVIVAVIAIAVCAFLLTQNNDKSTTSDGLTGNYLVVYGNANGDAYLNQDDVDFIQDILDGKTTWSKADNPYADTDHNGKITSNDVTVLKKFLKGEKATMYYTDWNLEVDSINYPLTGKVAVTQVESIYMSTIVGFYDDITHINRPESWFASNLRTDMFPGLIDRVKSTGNYNLNIENVVSSGVSIVLGAISSLDDNTRATLKSYGIQGIALPVMKDMNGLDWNTSIVTLGVMMNKQKNTAEYIEYLADLQQKVSKAAEKISGMTFIDVFGPVGKDDTTMSIETEGQAGISYGDVVNMKWINLVPAFTAAGDGYVTVETEKVITANPDVILVLTFGTFSESDTPESLKAAYVDQEAFRGTDAYANKNVYFAAWNVYGSVLGLPCILYLASQIWPDVFDEDEAVQIAQEFFDKFTNLNKDVKDVLGLFPVRMS